MSETCPRCGRQLAVIGDSAFCIQDEDIAICDADKNRWSAVAKGECDAIASARARGRREAERAIVRLLKSHENAAVTKASEMDLDGEGAQEQHALSSVATALDIVVEAIVVGEHWKETTDV